MTTDEYVEYIASLVESAPPLTAEQRALLVVLLG